MLFQFCTKTCLEEWWQCCSDKNHEHRFLFLSLSVIILEPALMLLPIKAQFESKLAAGSNSHLPMVVGLLLVIFQY